MYIFNHFLWSQYTRKRFKWYSHSLSLLLLFFNFLRTLNVQTIVLWSQPPKSITWIIIRFLKTWANRNRYIGSDRIDSKRSVACYQHHFQFGAFSIRSVRENTSGQNTIIFIAYKIPISEGYPINESHIFREYNWTFIWKCFYICLEFPETSGWSVWSRIAAN